MSNDAPKLFISYSWSSPDHKQWVLELATQLREDGVDVILDRWHLKEGNDAYKFMEKMVTDPDIKKVILICDKRYAEKADDRSGGVGTEAQIISPELYKKAEQDKFVAIVAERDEKGEPYLPTYYKSRKYIDYSDKDEESASYDELLRWVHDEPLNVKPELGKKPAHLSEDNPILLGTSSKHKRALDAIKNNKSNAKGAIDEYFEIFVENLERFRIVTNSYDKYDDLVVESIKKFLPYRDEAMAIFKAIAQYRNNEESWQQVHHFFESLIPYKDMPEGVHQGHVVDYDNFKFITHELFLYAVATFIKHECFEAVAYLLDDGYYYERNADYGRESMPTFTIFYQRLESLLYRSQQPNRLSF